MFSIGGIMNLHGRKLITRSRSETEEQLDRMAAINIEIYKREMDVRYEPPLILDCDLLIAEEPYVAEIIERRELTPGKIAMLAKNSKNDPEINAVISTAMRAALRMRASHTREIMLD